MVEMYSLEKVKDRKGRKIVMYLEMDVANPESIQHGFNLVNETLQEYAKELEMKRWFINLIFMNDNLLFIADLKLTTLINNAGIMQIAQEEPGVEALTPKKDVYMKHLKINAVGPVLVTAVNY